MRSFKFVHTADLHLDSPFQGIGRVDGEVQKMLLIAPMQAFRNIVDLCIKEAVDFLLIAGDLYDEANSSLRAQLYCRDEFRRLTDRGIQVYVAHGNHDHCGGWRADLDWPTGVHFFSAGQVDSFIVSREGEEICRIHGISYPERAVTANYLPQFPPAESVSYNIGVLHTNVGTALGHANYAPSTLSELVKTGYDYWALGHIHTCQTLHADKPMIVYPGTPQGRNPVETGPKGCCLIEVGTGGKTVKHWVETDVARWLNLEVRITEFSRLEELLIQLETVLDGVGDPDTRRMNLVHIRLTGRGPLYDELRRDGLIQDLVQRLREGQRGVKNAVWVRGIDNAAEPELAVEELRQEESLLGDFLKLTARAKNLEANPELSMLLQEAIRPLFKERLIRKILEEPEQEQLVDLVRRSEQTVLELFHLEVNR